jgi:hypothetical protein
MAVIVKEVEGLLRHVGRERDLLCKALKQKPRGDVDFLVGEIGHPEGDALNWIDEVEELHDLILAK